MSSKKITIKPELAAFLRSVDEPNVGALADSGEDPEGSKALEDLGLHEEVEEQLREKS